MVGSNPPSFEGGIFVFPPASRVTDLGLGLVLWLCRFVEGTVNKGPGKQEPRPGGPQKGVKRWNVLSIAKQQFCPPPQFCPLVLFGLFFFWTHLDPLTLRFLRPVWNPPKVCPTPPPPPARAPWGRKQADRRGRVPLLVVGEPGADPS